MPIPVETAAGPGPGSDQARRVRRTITGYGPSGMSAVGRSAGITLSICIRRLSASDASSITRQRQLIAFQLEGGVGPAASGQHHGRRLLMPGVTPHGHKRAGFVGGSDYEQPVLCAIVWMLPRVSNGGEV